MDKRKRHLHADYGTSWCGLDASFILMTYDPEAAACGDCLAAEEAFASCVAAEAERAVEEEAELARIAEEEAALEDERCKREEEAAAAAERAREERLAALEAHIAALTPTTTE